MVQDPRLRRTSSTTLTCENRWKIPTTICANDQVPIEERSTNELLSLLETQHTVDLLKDKKFLPQNASIQEVVITPDFHKGKGVPIGTVIATKGFVIPQAIGNDVNCGMRLSITSITKDQLDKNLPLLENSLRHIFFEGGRNLPTTSHQRESLLKYGIQGLIDTYEEIDHQGLWNFFNPIVESVNSRRIHGQGSYKTENIFALSNYVNKSKGVSYDSITGSIGGGNHFVEIQYVKKILHGQTAYDWGIKEGQVAVMVHTGSLGLGHITGQHFLDVMKQIYPKSIPHPQNKIYLLPNTDQYRSEFNAFFTSMYNAANFAFGNRLFLSLMAKFALNTSVNQLIELSTIYDAPHNLVWKETLEGQEVFIHRKGATPAYGCESMAGTPYAFYGEPVIVPGSMGASSYLLCGLGNRKFLNSAPHGAGRQMSRGSAVQTPDGDLDRFLSEFRVVTPIDLSSQLIKSRPDIVSKACQDLKKEAPYAYKEITPVIQSVSDAEVAYPVAEFYPIITVKG